MRGELFHFNCQDVPTVAVLIMRTPDGGTHTGIIHREGGRLFILDLQWEYRLGSRETHEELACVVPNIDDDAKNDVAGLCRLINARNNDLDPGQRYKIPYSFRYRKARFNVANGELMLKQGLGLNCSTFVLAVFESALAPLVDFNGWEIRPSDELRQNDLLEKMRTGIPKYNIPPVDPQRILMMESEIPSFRVAPEEVAAAGMADDAPANFDQAERGGRWILSVLTEGTERLVI